MKQWIKKVFPELVPLYNEKQIADRVGYLACLINADYKDKELAVVLLYNGSFIFAADLLRQLHLPLEMHGFSVKSYTGKKSVGKLKFDKHDIPDCKDKHVVLVDDVLDTGLTMSEIKAIFEKQGALSIKVCCLLNKKSNRKKEIHADYVGFEINDEFVLGYGLDLDNKYRQLPFIGYIP